MANKTIRVAPLVAKLQRAITLADTELERKALVWALETVLHDSGNYRGFQFDVKTLDARVPGDEDYYKRTYYLPKV